jgi:hypothetical protein
MSARDIHATSLAISTALSGYYVPNMIAPLDVIAVLNESGVRFVLVGTHSLGGWLNKPRASESVTVLVATPDYHKAIAMLRATYPHLTAEVSRVLARLRDPTTKQDVIDVIRPNRELCQATLTHTLTVASEGQSYQIPSLEMALAMKFASLIQLTWGSAEKYQEIHDFMRIVQFNSGIDLEKLAELGEIDHPGGGKEIVELVRQVRAREKLKL